MERKLPVLIAIILALAIALAACQSQTPPPATDPLPSHVQESQPQPQPESLPAVPADPQPAAPAPASIDPAPASTEPAAAGQITMDEAIAIALKDAGFAEKDVKGLHAELDRDDGITYYDVEFYQGSKEYDYEIHAETGKILKPVKKAATTGSSTSKSDSSGSSSGASTSKNITKDQAISKALSHAGLKKSQVSRLRAELDKDDGVTLYEIEFETAQWEYEYEVNAKTGKILKAEKDRND